MNGTLIPKRKMGSSNKVDTRVEREKRRRNLYTRLDNLEEKI